VATRLNRRVEERDKGMRGEKEEKKTEEKRFVRRIQVAKSVRKRKSSSRSVEIDSVRVEPPQESLLPSPCRVLDDRNSLRVQVHRNRRIARALERK